MTDRDYDLIVRALDGSVPPEDRERFAIWLHVSLQFREDLERLSDLRTAMSWEVPSFGPDFTDRVMRRLHETRRGEPRRALPLVGRYRAFGSRNVLASAVLFLALVAVGAAVWLFPRSIYVAPGEKHTVKLTDGSIVELASGSTLIRSLYWHLGQRTVRLEGEAFFDVAKHGRPFTVRTFNADVVVQGTRFNVRAWPKEMERETLVTVEQGQVEVAARHRATRPLTLTSGQTTLVASDSPLRIASLPLDRVLAWREGHLAFYDEPLEDVVPGLERHFALRVVLGSTDVAKRRVTHLSPATTSIEEVLEVICLALDLRYRRILGGYEIVSREPSAA